VNRLRVALLTQRFWPMVSSPGRAVANLATALAEQGVEPIILTVRWESPWPARLRFRDMPVVRFEPPPRGRRDTFCYVRSLARWLQQNRNALDLVYATGLKHEAYAAMRAVGGRLPVVLRPETAGLSGDCLWQIDAPQGEEIKRQCVGASAFVAANHPLERELQAAGYPRDRIHYLPDGVPIPSRRTAAIQAAARMLLGETGRRLALPREAPLAVYCGTFQPDRRLEELLAAWARLLVRRRDARLWLVGEGPHAPRLAEGIREWNLTSRVSILGPFDEIDAVLAAADLFIMPSDRSETSLALLEAMAAGLGIVAVDSPGTREVLCDGQSAMLVRPGDPAAMADAVERLIEQPTTAEMLGAAARQVVVERFSLAQMGARHVTLFTSLTMPVSPTPDAP